MSLAAYKNSQDLDVLSATPMQLVRMLYVGAIGSIQSACEHLRNGEIRERSRQITKACSIIEELTLSLDKERGGQVARASGFCRSVGGISVLDRLIPPRFSAGKWKAV